MYQSNPVYSYDIVCLRLHDGDKRYLYDGYKYEHGPLFRTSEQLYQALSALMDMRYPQKTIQKDFGFSQYGKLDVITGKAIYATEEQQDGKYDIVLTPMKLYPDRDIVYQFYTYHTMRLGVSVAPSDDRLYDIVRYQHGPLFSGFEVLKPALLSFCAGKCAGSARTYPQLYDQVSMMTADLTNIGRWHKSFTEKTVTDGFSDDTVLSVCRVQTEG